MAAYSLRIAVEEKVLFQNLEEDYRRYAERTKRLIPGIF
jgi:protein-S-isoprenylcysteine O-methyltransferase Ste14